MTSPSGKKLAERKLAEPHKALAGMAAKLRRVATRTVPLSQSAGLVLAREIFADRDHPSIDVSAVDGYALRLSQANGSQKISADVRIGFEPPAMPSDGVVKIVTGAAVPTGAEAIVRREEITEFADHIEFHKPVELKMDQDVRRRGDNIRADQPVLSSGIALGPQHLAAAASFGAAEVSVHRPVRVSVIVSGDELLGVEEIPQPWQIRDSHGFALPALLQSVKWLDCISLRRVPDDPADIDSALQHDLEFSDAVILSGGVSMGDRDFVPDAIAKAGGQVQFHGLAIRPGRPMLGAIGSRGQVIFGLPGNPLSVLVTARRFVMIALRKLAGLAMIDPPAARYSLVSTDHFHRQLWYYPPAVVEPDGRARIIPAHSSGDLVTAGKSEGFVEIPPGTQAPNSVAFFRWDQM